SIRLDQPRIMLHATADGQSNWDIFGDTADAAPDDDGTEPSRFGLNIERLTMRDGRIGYTDDSLRLHVALQPAQLDLKGRLSAVRSLLDLQADLGEVTLWYDGNCLVNHVRAAWDASIDAHLDSMHFMLKDNEMRINDLAIALAGTATVREDGLLTDLTFDAPSAQLKSLLSLIPAIYMQDYASLRTDGILHASGSVRGLADSVRIPDLTLKLQVADGTVHYETLPEKIQDIQLDLDAFCDGADMDRSTVTLHRAGFSMAGNPFTVSGAVSTPVSNLNLQAEARGTVRLGTLDRYIPIEAGTVRGTLRADTRLQLRMNDLDEGRYERIQCSGTMGLDGFSLATDSLPPLAVRQADLQFSPQSVSLKTAGIRLGNSRIETLDGSLSQFIPYLFSDAVLQGTLQMQAQCIDLNEWMTDDEAGDTGDTVVLETPFIPADVDLRIKASADTVLYDNLVLKQTTGDIRVTDRCVMLQPVTTKLLGGDFTLNGSYNTQDTLAPAFDLAVDIRTVETSALIRAFETLQRFIPQADLLKGKLSANLSVASVLNRDMTPALETMQAFGDLRAEQVSISKSPVLNAVTSMLHGSDTINAIILKDTKISFTEKDGRVTMSPFSIPLSDGIALQLGGSVGLDRTLDYQIKAKVPGALAAKLVGGKAGEIMSYRDDLTVTGKIAGTTQKPRVTLDLKDMLQENVVEQAKETGRAIVTAQVERMSAAAAAKIREEAQQAADKTRQEADKAAQKLIDAAAGKGLLQQAAAAVAAEKLRTEADRAAKKILEEAEKRIQDGRPDEAAGDAAGEAVETAGNPAAETVGNATGETAGAAAEPAQTE
ncbi:MAG: hypothetical protein J6X20_06800, partial [Bacteroidales bacterium]|nr:hypothetical protein [Bacteroidales bacterium]